MFANLIHLMEIQSLLLIHISKMFQKFDIWYFSYLDIMVVMLDKLQIFSKKDA